MRLTIHAVSGQPVRTLVDGVQVGGRQVRPCSSSSEAAHFEFSPEAWFRAIYAGETPVGFLMMSVQPEHGEYYLWRFMIDARHQGKASRIRARKRGRNW